MKKIIVLIVEGISDERVLTAGLSDLLEDRHYNIKVFRGNLLNSDLGSEKPSKALIGDYLNRELFEKQYLKKEDIAGIFQLADVDDVFVSDEISLNKFEKLHKKRLKELSTASKIMSIPYSLYYMSSNLEDVLVNRKKCNDGEKEEISIEFALKYDEDYDGFKKFFEDISRKYFEDYKSSWHYIKDIKNSSEGITNIFYMLEEIEAFKHSLS